MPLSQGILIVLAGLAAGAINLSWGRARLITFPTLVAMGYSPVTSTMSNAVGLVAGDVSGTWGYRRELRGQWQPAALADSGVAGRGGGGRLAAAASAGESVHSTWCRCC